MISIIICSINKDHFSHVHTNIQSTIGDIEYEIIRIDNNDNKYSICQAYNLGAQQSRYPILCFVHEDVCFKTQNWGYLLSEHCKNPQIGLIGVAGSICKTKTISSWGTTVYTFRMHLLQGYKNNGDQPRLISVNPDNVKSDHVVCIDGFFMVTPKKVWESVKFDEKKFQKFHCYDIDYSLSVYQSGYGVSVCYDILLEHCSEGSFNATWYEENIKLHDKWKKLLPVALREVSTKEKIYAEWEGKKKTSKILIENGYSVSAILQNIFGRMYKFSFSLCLICLIQTYKAVKIHNRKNKPVSSDSIF